MNNLFITLSVKFRAFGITFGTLNKEFVVPIPAPVPLPRQNLLTFSERGVNLTIALI